MSASRAIYSTSKRKQTVDVFLKFLLLILINTINQFIMLAFHRKTIKNI